MSDEWNTEYKLNKTFSKGLVERMVEGIVPLGEPNFAFSIRDNKLLFRYHRLTPDGTYELFVQGFGVHQDAGIANYEELRLLHDTVRTGYKRQESPESCTFFFAIRDRETIEPYRALMEFAWKNMLPTLVEKNVQQDFRTLQERIAILLQNPFNVTKDLSLVHDLTSELDSHIRDKSQARRDSQSWNQDKAYHSYTNIPYKLMLEQVEQIVRESLKAPRPDK
jgi:hypothetical protein